MGTTPPRASAGLQQYQICSHGVLTPLFHVREATSLPFFFPIGVNTSRCCVPAYVEEVQKCFKEAYAETQHQSNSEADRQKCNYDKSTSTVQLMPRDVVLKKADTFQGSKVEYEVICQVANGVPSYEIKNSSGNVKDAHHNRLPVGHHTRWSHTLVQKWKCLHQRVQPVCPSRVNSIGVWEWFARRYSGGVPYPTTLPVSFS